MSRLFVFVLLASLLAAPTLADEKMTRQLPEGSASPAAGIEDVAWIAGNWQGEAFGGTVEEVWAAPSGGAMMGMFRLVTGDAVGFYELMIIRELGDSLTLQLKHFNADLTGWEEKAETVDFPLVELADGAAWFAGLTLRQEGPDALTVWVLVDDAGGHQEVEFRYRRAP